jgi:hypothetical protein
VGTWPRTFSVFASKMPVKVYPVEVEGGRIVLDAG